MPTTTLGKGFLLEDGGQGDTTTSPHCPSHLSPHMLTCLPLSHSSHSSSFSSSHFVEGEGKEEEEDQFWFCGSLFLFKVWGLGAVEMGIWRLF